MMRIDIIDLGASLVKKGVALWQGITRISEDEADVEPMGEGDVYQSLGITSFPYPADDKGKAEGLCVRGVAGRDTTFIGGRDTRSAAIVGNGKPGDTIMHSTGPEQAAQVQCKEEKRQVIAATKTKRGKGMAVILDGSTGKIQITIPGMLMEMDSEKGTFTLTNGKASIIMDGATIALDGVVVAGGRRPHPAFKFMVSPMVGKAPKPVAIGTPGNGVQVAMVAGAAKGFYPAA